MAFGELPVGRTNWMTAALFLLELEQEEKIPLPPPHSQTRAADFGLRGEKNCFW